ncbi:MAG: LysR family transcriptional regulator [Pseudomonadota bacterium]
MTKYERSAFNTDMLRSFVAIAEHRHLTVAADTLGRTQSALSVHLRKMEDGLGVRLFDRHSRGMSLTAEGQKMLPVAHGILGEIARLGAMFDHPLRGQIRVGIPDHYDDMIFETVLAEFSRIYPEVDLTVTSGCSSGFATAVESGKLDLAVVTGPALDADTVLESEATYWVEGAGFHHDPDAPVPLAILNRGCWWSRLPFNALERHGRDYTVKFQSSSFSNLRCAIRAGLAIGVLPARAIQQGMQIAEPSRNLPDLPAIKRSLIVSPKAPQDIAQEIASKLREGLRQTAMPTGV